MRDSDLLTLGKSKSKQCRIVVVCRSLALGYWLGSYGNTVVQFFSSFLLKVATEFVEERRFHADATNPPGKSEPNSDDAQIETKYNLISLSIVHPCIDIC